MTTKQTATCRIDIELMNGLRQYSEKTGVPTNKCVEEAVATWLQCIAPTRIEAMQRVRFNENGVGSVSGIVGHKDVTEEDFVAQGIERMKDPKVKK